MRKEVYRVIGICIHIPEPQFISFVTWARYSVDLNHRFSTNWNYYDQPIFREYSVSYSHSLFLCLVLSLSQTHMHHIYSVWVVLISGPGMNKYLVNGNSCCYYCNCNIIVILLVKSHTHTVTFSDTSSPSNVKFPRNIRFSLCVLGIHIILLLTYFTFCLISNKVFEVMLFVFLEDMIFYFSLERGSVGYHLA